VHSAVSFLARNDALSGCIVTLFLYSDIIFMMSHIVKHKFQVNVANFISIYMLYFISIYILYLYFLIL